MRIDSRGLPPGETLEADLCIVGAGAAGIAMALELADGPLDVVLLESGGLELEPAIQALYRGEVVGRAYYPLEAARLRVFGGTTGHWAGLCRPLDPLDYEVRPWVPHSGWPFGAAELEPWVERARRILEIEPEIGRFDATGGDAPAEEERLPFPAERVRTALMHFSPPTRFGTRYRAALERARNVRVLLHANAVALDRERDADRLVAVRCRTLEGGAFAVRARHTVLACGAIENARLLLASDAVERDGLGNRRGLVGRYFMEHPHLDAGGEWLLPDAAPLRPLYRWPDPDGGYRGCSLAVLTFPTDVLEREGMLGWSAELQLRRPARETDGFASARELARSARAGEWPDALGRHVRNVLGDLGSLADEAWDTWRGSVGEDASYLLKLRVEQAPSPESRVRLGSERDALGMRRPVLDWRLGELDLASLHRGLELLAVEVGRAGLGRVRIPEEHEREAWAAPLRGGWHHMGTTRMAADPAQGVVDADGRVHGLANLHVAGSSVFPTAGWANPTLTLVALAVRLADHLRTRLARGETAARGGERSPEDVAR